MFLATSGRLHGLALLSCALLPLPEPTFADPTGYPLQITNCDRVTRYTQPPERTVSIGQGTTYARCVWSR